MAKCLFYAADPGGYQSILAFAKYFPSEVERHLIYSPGLITDLHPLFVPAIDVSEYNLEDLRLFSSRLFPDIIITSCCSYGFFQNLEKSLWQIGDSLSIPTVAILDSPQNHLDRFLDISGALSEPKILLVPTQHCRETLCDKLSCEIIVSGLLQRTIPSHVVTKRRTVRNIVFISEAIAQYYKDSRGYDQYAVLRTLAVLNSRRECPLPIDILPHPKEPAGKLLMSLEPFCFSTRIIDKQYLTSSPGNSCIYIGMSSILLIELFVAGRSIISFQPDRCVLDPFLLSRINIIPQICTSDYSDLDELLALARNSLSTTSTIRYANELEPKNSVIFNLIRSLLCQF